MSTGLWFQGHGEEEIIVLELIDEVVASVVSLRGEGNKKRGHEKGKTISILEFTGLTLRR